MATVALGIVLENVVLFTFGKEPRGMPSGILTTAPVHDRGRRRSTLQFSSPWSAWLAAGAAAVFRYRQARQGVARGGAERRRGAAHGHRVERVIDGGVRAVGLLAGIAGILIAPLFTVSADMGTLFGIKAFAVAILGGIDSAWGVVLAGLLYGVAEALITALLGSATRRSSLSRSSSSCWRWAERSPRPRARAEGMSARCTRAAGRDRCCRRRLLHLARQTLQRLLSRPSALTAIVGTGLNVLIGLTGQIRSATSPSTRSAPTPSASSQRARMGFWPALPSQRRLAALAGVLLAIPALACADLISRWSRSPSASWSSRAPPSGRA